MNTTATLEPLLATERKKNIAMKRAKWHLGIRSQSKPQDIMHEVFRAMKTLGYVSDSTGHTWKGAIYLHNETFEPNWDVAL